VTTCPECGTKFAPHTHRGPPRQFCTEKCKKAFYNLMLKRGGVLAPLAIVWRGGKHKRSDVSAYALVQMAALADLWRAEDKGAGRNVALIVERKRASGWVAADIS